MTNKDISIRMSCELFGISETCYRYQAKLNNENATIADWLLRLAQRQRNWGFGLCFLYLRNVKGFSWNHKRVYRIYRKLELNMRIKPKTRVALPRERFRDIPVPEIDSPTREAKGPGRPASVNICSERAKHLPPTMTDAFSYGLIFFLRKNIRP